MISITYQDFAPPAISAAWLNSVDKVASSAIVVNTILAVPSQYATIQTALSYLNNFSILPGVSVTIQVADGVYNFSSSIYIAHPFGANIHIIGNIATPDNCLLNFSASDGFYVPPGFAIGEIDGFRVVKIGAKANLGFGTDGGSYLKLGPNVKIDNFYYGIACRNRGYVNAGGTATNYVRVTNAGDVGIWAYVGAFVNCEYADTSLCADAPNGLGGGIVAEFSSSIQANMAKTHGNYLCGLSALSNSTIRAWSVQSFGNSQGVITGSGGKIELFNQAGAPTITQIINNTNYGHYCADSYGAVFGLSSALTTGNGTGVESIGFKFGSDGSTKIQSGSVTIDSTGPADVTAGSSYIDLNAPLAGFNIIRAMVSGVEASRIQYGNTSGFWDINYGGTAKVRFGSGTILADGGASAGYIDVNGATGQFAISRWLINNVERSRAQYDAVNSVWVFSVNNHVLMRGYDTGKTTLGNGAPATGAVSGHLQIPVQAGAPTGVVTDVQSGYLPIVIDSTNSKLWVYIGGVWKSTLLT